MKFDNMVKVYSIWIVANMESNSVNHIHFVQDTLYGTYKWTGDTNVINIVIAGITGKPDELGEEINPAQADSVELCRMLNTLFAVKLDNRMRFQMLADDFGIDIDKGLREDVEAMCNLGQGLLEKGVNKAQEEAIINFYKVGVNVTVIAQAMGKTEEEIEKVLTDHGVNLDH